MNGDVLTQNLQELKERVFHDKEHLTSANASWDVQRDARIIALGKFINIVERTQFGVHLLGKLLDEDWYQTNLDHPTQQEPDYKLILTVEFEKSTKYNFGMSLFILIESSLRVFLRAIDPIACRGSTTAFESIYNALLGSNQLNFPNPERQNIIEILNFIRLVRNLIHNDGVYFDQNGHNSVVTYQGNTYRFVNGQPVNFVYWSLLLLQAEDIRQILMRLISDGRIIAIPHIADPFASHSW
jgi:hypothetical protein